MNKLVVFIISLVALISLAFGAYHVLNKSYLDLESADYLLIFAICAGLVNILNLNKKDG